MPATLALMRGMFIHEKCVRKQIPAKTIVLLIVIYGTTLFDKKLFCSALCTFV